MKKIIIILAILCSSAFYQEVNAQKTIETSFKVRGNCGQCKDRIEESVMRLKGVKTAEWDKNTEMITVVYKPKKQNEEALHSAISTAGHSTDKMECNKENYDDLPDCCKYDHNKHKH